MKQVRGFRWLRRPAIALVVALLLLAVLSPALVLAQSSIDVLSSTTKAEFPQRLTFNLSARSSANILDVRLQYKVDRASFADVTSESFVEFIPAPKIDVSWIWDMKKSGGLPPGTTIDYWWKIRDANGNETVTPSKQIKFEDTRYSWQNLRQGKITIYWYREDVSFAQELMTASQQAMSRLLVNAESYLNRPIKIYIYDDAQGLRGAMINPQEWTGGVAFTEYSTLAIGISPRTLDWGKRAISHELTHLVVHQMILNPYSGLPTWLDEGLAMFAEGEITAEYVTILKKAVAEDNLISVRSLSSPFSAYANESYLAYGESASLVSYLISTYGQPKMIELLNTFKQGSTYDDALRKVYGFDMDGLNARWRGYIKAPTKSAERRPLSPVAIGFSLAGAGAIGGFLVVARNRLRRD